MDEINHSPQGIPSVTYVRILSPPGDNSKNNANSDLQTEGNTITVTEPGHPPTKHEVAQLLETGMGDQDVCENTIGNEAGAGLGAALNPITAFVHDSATAVILLVGSKQTKKWMFLKRTFLPFLANELFGTIADKEENPQTGDMYQATVKLSAFEIQDEVITDLQRPTSRGLMVSVVNPEVGVCIPGLHQELCKDELTLRRQLLETCENRASHTLPPGASIDTSTTIWEFNLTQSEVMTEADGTSSDQLYTSHSRLLVVDVPSVDSLVMKQADMNLLAGPKLNKSLITFVDVVRKLSSPARAALAPFRSSKLTHYLSELLGGNALVVALGLVTPGEPLQSRSTLAVMGALSRAVHYPISAKEYTDVLQGLLCKYRSLILQLEDEIENGAPIGASASPQVITEKLVNNLQQELAKSVLDKNVALEDTARLYEMLDLLKAKYKTLMEAKNVQSKELIVSEEEKMTVSRALVELKLKYSAFHEQSEKEKYELTTAMMTAKNELYDLDAQLLLSQTEATGLKEQVVQLTNDLGDSHSKCVAAEATINELRTQMAQLNDRNLELSSELVTLLNQNEALNVTCKDLRNKSDEYFVKVEALTAKNNENEVVIDDLRSMIRDAEEKLLVSRKEQGEAELELKSLKLQIDRNKLDYERSAADFLRTKDNTYNKAKRQCDLDMHAIQKSKEELQMKLRNQDRRVREQDREIERYKDDMLVIKKEKNTLESDLEESRQAYRGLLASQLIHLEVGGSGHKDALLLTNNPIVKRTSSGKDITRPNINSVVEDELMHNLIASYTKVEKDSRIQIEHLRGLLNTMKSHYRALYDKYRFAIDYIEEKLPGTIQTQTPNDDVKQSVASDSTALDQEMGRKNALSYIVEEQTLNKMLSALEENELFLYKTNIISDPTDEEFDENDTELMVMTKKYRKAERQLTMEKERVAVMVGTYKKHIEKNECKINAQQAEITSLNVKIKQLMEHSEEWKVEASFQYKEKLRKYINEMKKQQEMDRKEFEIELKKAKGKEILYGEGDVPLDKEGESDNKKSLFVTDKDILNSFPDTPPSRKSTPGSRIESKGIEQPQSHSDLIQQLSEKEQKNVILNTKNIALEEELRNYKIYMRESITNYKKQVIELKSKLISSQQYIGQLQSLSSMGNVKGMKSANMSNAINKTQSVEPAAPLPDTLSRLISDSAMVTDNVTSTNKTQSVEPAAPLPDTLSRLISDTDQGEEVSADHTEPPRRKISFGAIGHSQ